MIVAIAAESNDYGVAADDSKSVTLGVPVTALVR